MVPKYISSAEDLVTTHEQVRAGFLEQAIQKTEIATPYIEDAVQFRKALEGIGNIDELVHKPHLLDKLLTAAAFSQKAKNHLTTDELQQALADVIKTLAASSTVNWKEELVSRFLLTKGESLGGSMRNITGASGGAKFSDAILNDLKSRDLDFNCQQSNKGKLQEISWSDRIMLFDKKTPQGEKNIDVILLDASNTVSSAKVLLNTEKRILACGEIKGGIDPAGADEHWKTANSALGRIRTTFTHKPSLFFVGAAIQTSMANEIFCQLNDGRLSHAANLTVQQQLEDLASWLCEI